MVNLGVVNVDDFQSAAVDINALGHAVGTSTLKNGLARAALFRNGSAIGLTPELPPYEGTSFASAINDQGDIVGAIDDEDRKSTRLNSSHLVISYAVFCLKK